MQLTPEQVKGRIKNVAKENKADARTLMRIYMMERFLERVASSQYKDNFIIKGGMLVTAMAGVALRSTMDIDTSIKNQNLSAEDARRIVDEIKDIDLGDGVTFEVKEVSNIMDEMEYPGIRFTMNAVMGKLVTPMKIDISTGDVITPRAIEYNYKLLLDDRSISQLRCNGYLAALRDNGVAFDPALLVETGGCFTMPEAYRGTAALIESGTAFTALFTLSDTMAMAALKALTDHGRQVPRDCSVIAIDGLSMSEYLVPTLTTMVQPAEEMGRQAVAILLDMLSGGSRQRHVRLEATLRQGGSVRPL